MHCLRWKVHGRYFLLQCSDINLKRLLSQCWSMLTGDDNPTGGISCYHIADKVSFLRETRHDDNLNFRRFCILVRTECLYWRQSSAPCCGCVSCHEEVMLCAIPNMRRVTIRASYQGALQAVASVFSKCLHGFNQGLDKSCDARRTFCGAT